MITDIFRQVTGVFFFKFPPLNRLNISFFSAHECFKKLDKDAVERNRNARLTSDKILEFPELKVSNDYFL